MRKAHSLPITALILLFATPLTASADLQNELLESWRASRVERAEKIDRAEIDRVELLFADSIDRPWDARVEQAWRELGFSVRRLRLHGEDCHTISESDDARAGRGFFLVCPTRTEAGTLFVPHGWSDRMTAEIGAYLAVEGRFRASAWNTTPRQIDPDHPHLDLTTAEESYFTAMARAAAVVGVAEPTLQLHGFAPYRRSTEEGRNARAILSSGTADPARPVHEIADCLDRTMGKRFLVYPTDVIELGGTSDRVGRLLRDWGRRDFIHLELSFALRRRLVEEPETRRILFECLVGNQP
jgi:hypothetical protein